jgi:hypothetical protein
VSETVTNSCVMDFPQAWEYIRGTDKDDHHRKCSYRVSSMLCDCDVIWAEYRKHAIAALEARLAALTSLCREYIDALDSGYDVLASHATDKIREAINPPQQEREP